MNKSNPIKSAIDGSFNYLLKTNPKNKSNYEWVQDKQRISKMVKCPWCNKPWKSKFNQHIFNYCTPAKSVREKFRVSSRLSEALRIDENLINTVRFLDEFFSTKSSVLLN